VWVGSLVVKELKRIIESSEITKWVSSLFALFNSLILLREDDTNWPKKNIVGKQELEIRIGNDHISFEVRFNLDIFNFLLCRPPRSVPWLIFRIARILRGFASSITWFKTSRFVCPSYLPFSPYLKIWVSA